MKMIKLLIAASILSGCQFASAQSTPANQTPVGIPSARFSDFSFDDQIKKDRNDNRRIEVGKANSIALALGLPPSQSTQKYLSIIEMAKYDISLKDLLLKEVINKDFMNCNDIQSHFINAAPKNGKNYKILGDYFKDLSASNPIMLYFVQQKKPLNPAYTKSEIITFNSTKRICTAITTEIKERNCFQSNGNTEKESTKTSMAHEMGHVFLVHGWPELRTTKFLPAYVAHEAFAVYTEYLYLKNNNNVAPFDIIDFITDSAEDNGVYSVNPDYMLCFLKGLDYGKLDFDNLQDLNVKHIPFNYDFLSQASELCKKLKNKQNINDGDYKYQLVITNCRSDAAQQQNIKEEVSATIDFRLFVEPFNKESETYVINTLTSNPKLSSHPPQKYSWRTGFESLIKRKKTRNLVRQLLIQNVLNELTNNQLKKNIDIYSVDRMIP